jgi:hypothetical protein
MYNTPECYISGDNARFFAEVAKVKKERKFNEVVIYPMSIRSS